MTDDKRLSAPEPAGVRLAHEIRRRRTAAGLSQPQLARMIGYTRQYVSLAERVDHNLPSAEIVRALDKGLRAEGALVELREQGKHEQEQRRGRSLAGRSVGGDAVSLPRSAERADMAGLLAPVRPLPVPSVVGMAEVEEIRAVAWSFRNWDAVYGGGLVRAAVTAQLRYCADLLGARCSDSVRAGLFSAVGHLGLVTGFMAFDAYAHEDARRIFRFALACAEEVGDWHLRAKVLSTMARQAIWCGDPDAGLTFSELALVRSDRLTSTERAMLHTARGRAFARLGRIEDTVAAVGVADEEFGRSRPVDDPPWMRYYDAAQHAGDTGHALWDIAIHGHLVDETRRRLANAVAGHGDEYVRARVISQTKLASLVMATGDPTEATVLGTQALGWAGTVKSRRAADDLLELRRFALPHDNLVEVSELRHRISTAVAE
ncbi:helix-turn-helix domain-containing protein [Saccharothrix longispora]|uniref:Transcriptional regulator with XRE-family HTH domain n=1 Tax=Saccharothrix longispora TaxID=33920 RepID=A0ABU1PPA7_9PSEU|nr:helix-turn-helix transcriptional regulator [Saccharothrix longispora]MDR6592489.1 transcriptional regulator with XRE-family HTH domain [Saccharothrix longispora]